MSLAPFIANRELPQGVAAEKHELLVSAVQRHEPRVDAAGRGSHGCHVQHRGGEHGSCRDRSSERRGAA
jgi:hypothetical protein